MAEGRSTPVPGTPDAVAGTPDGGHDFTTAGGSAGPANATAYDHAALHAPAPQTPALRGRRRAVLAWSLSVAGVLLLAGLATVLQLTANLGYDQARTGLASAVSTQSDEATHNDRVRAVDDESARAADTLLAVTDPALVGDADRAALTAARDRAQKASAAAMSLSATPVPEPGAKPFWFWELYARTARLDADSRAMRTLGSALGRSSEELGSATSALDKTGVAVANAAGGLAAQIENDNRPSPNAGVLAMRDLAAKLVATTSFDEEVAQGFRDYAASIQKVRDGHAATLAAEAGPLQGARQEIEDFARGLAPGVLLDFEWADRVNDLGGDNGYLSGETVWPTTWGQYATIRLSNSVAEDWPGPSSHALVAHEVGHAITTKCWGMYDTTNSQTVEAWATAWAISMGFTDEGNGTQAYGPPPQELIDKAAACR